jgi:diaminopimelate epimerase
LRLPVSKYHGLGNDFLIVDLRERGNPRAEDPAVVRALCQRRFGAGADGVLAILPPETPGADARMRVLNADGSEAEMCGNGIRCVVKHLVERDPSLRRNALTVDTGAGPLECAVHATDGVVHAVTVDMGRPRLERAEIPMTGPPEGRCQETPIPGLARELAVTCVSMGNPHAVAFVEESGAALRELAETVGPAVEQHAWFPERANCEVARVHAPDQIELVVWERGVGITLACGTGACAAAVAACVTGRARPETDIALRLLGGELSVRVAADLGGVTMTGPAVHVFDAEVADSFLDAN